MHALPSSKVDDLLRRFYGFLCLVKALLFTENDRGDRDPIFLKRFKGFLSFLKGFFKGFLSFFEGPFQGCISFLLKAFFRDAYPF